MIKICFVCLGNICRSPMAEFIMKDYVKKAHLENQIQITSRATSQSEFGNDMYENAKNVLDKYHVPYEKHFSKSLKKEDYEKYDYIIGMDNSNMKNMIQLFQKEDKLYRIMDFTDTPKEVEDPWYTRNFEQTYQDLTKGCFAFLKFLEEKK